MSTAQHPIGSGFGAKSTADDVLDGHDLTGRRALVTGGYSGIGIEMVRALVRSGAEVVVPARRPEAAHEALDGLERVEVGTLDLADQASVAAFAEDFLASGRTLDLVIDNAAVMACPETRVGPGWEAQFATNHLGHYALVNRLWPAISPNARVVALSSAGHRRSGIQWDDVQFEHGYDKWTAYGQAKTANALFAVQLDALAQDQGVRAFSVNPGGILTPLQRHLSQAEMVAMGWVDEQGRPTAGGFKTTEQGAATAIWAGTSDQLNGLGGLYCEDCEVAEAVAADDPGYGGVRPYAVDPDQARRLWDLSAELTGVNAFGSV